MNTTTRETKEQRIVRELRAHQDPRFRDVGEKLSRIQGWRAEQLRDLLKEML